MVDERDLVIHTIGHSNHAIVAFVDLLHRYGITLVMDVRSQPYSRWAHQFNRETLARDLQDAGIAYRFMGDALGGRPSDPDVYDPGQEHPDYRRLEQTPAYQTGIGQLLDLAGTERVAVMCSEGDYNRCHRHLLITQTLLGRGVRVLHIQPDGTMAEAELIPQQLALFE
jgi:uncharacterized protein (DUF488 family)